MDFCPRNLFRFSDFIERTKLDGWSEEEDVETDVYDEEFMQLQHDFEHFVVSDGNYYYQDGDREICISDKIHFQDYVSDPEYYSGTEFELRSIDPTRRLVAYVTYIEWGDLGHGPLCVASLDGQMQQAFKDTDAADLTYGWLSNGSLLYVGSEPRPTDDPDYDAEWNNTRPCIIIVRPDGTSSVFAHSPYFVAKARQ